MILPKYTKQKMEVLAKTQPDLHKTLNLHITEDFQKLSLAEQQGIVGGLMIETLLKGKGDPELYYDNIDTELDLDPYNIDDL